MPKFRNAYHDTVYVYVDGFQRHVAPGDVIDVPDGEAEGFAVQVGEPGAKWEAVGGPAKQAAKHAHEDDKSDDDRKAE
jgi:hypothetical protein